MLIIDDKTVYEIDEECIRKHDVRKECNLPDIGMREGETEPEEEKLKSEPDGGL